jgi:hypothetical protein
VAAEEIAHPARDFGERGQVAISSDFLVSMTMTRELVPEGSNPEAVSQFTLAPALDYFVVDSWSVGARLAYTRTSFEEAASGDGRRRSGGGLRQAVSYPKRGRRRREWT